MGFPINIECPHIIQKKRKRKKEKHLKRKMGNALGKSYNGPSNILKANWDNVFWYIILAKDKNMEREHLVLVPKQRNSHVPLTRVQSKTLSGE